MKADRKKRILSKLAEVVGGSKPKHQGVGGKYVRTPGTAGSASSGEGLTTERVKNLARRGKVTASQRGKAGLVTKTYTPADSGLV